MNIIKTQIARSIRKISHCIKVLSYYGKARFCPVCNKASSQFLEYGKPIPRKEAICVHCHSFERHRFLWVFLSEKTDFFKKKSKKILHIAPEQCFETRFKKIFKDKYITADLNNPQAMVEMDITDIKYPNSSFDIIYCSHVLEHVLEDRKAIGEFFRILKDDGWAILLVPIFGEKTFEDPSITSPSDRLKYFGEKDHVRKYGRDYIDRLKEAGFHVETTAVGDLVQTSDIIKMGLTPASSDIYFCTKGTSNEQ